MKIIKRNNNNIMDSNIINYLMDSNYYDKDDFNEESAYKCIQTIDINDIDNLSDNMKLENITFYQKDTNKKNNIILTNYFSYDKEKKYILNFKNLLYEIIIISILHFSVETNNPILNIITIDGMLSSIIFYVKFLEIKMNFLIDNRLNSVDRYIYYFLLIISYFVFDYIFWFKLTNILIKIMSIMICPNIMAQIYNINNYRKISNVIYNGYINLIKKILCRQIAKIINIIIFKCLNIEFNILYEELIPYYEKIDMSVIKLLVSACIFNYFDSKTIMRYPLIIYKNIMMKNRKYNITNDKDYLITIIKDKKWDMFLNIYTLNRVIRLLLNNTMNENEDSILTIQIEILKKRLAFKLGRIMICWTIMSSTNVLCGLLSYLLFISDTNKPLNYLINTILFCILSFLTQERILIIIACEIFYTITNSKVLNDIAFDTLCSIKTGLINIFRRIRLETIIFTLTTILYNYYNIFIFVICLINIISFARLYFIIIKKQITKKEPFKIVTTNTKTEIKEEFESDILIILKNKIIDIFKNNVLIKIFQPKTYLEFEPVLKININSFLILICGLFSSYDIQHIIFLPYIIQNILDIIF